MKKMKKMKIEIFVKAKPKVTYSNIIFYRA